MLYRYEISGLDDPHASIFSGLKDIFCYDYKVRQLVRPFDEELLSGPCNYEIEGCNENIPIRYFFTETGNKKFGEAIRRIAREVKEEGYQVKRIELDENDIEKFWYKDEYQVAVEASECLELL